jgi:hypothetical protein
VRKAFWEQLITALNEKSNLAQNVKPSTDAWIGGVSLILVATWSSTRAEIYINRGDQEKNKPTFDALMQEKEIIEKIFGGQLVWERMDNRVTSRVKSELAGVNIFKKELGQKNLWANFGSGSFARA